MISFCSYLVTIGEDIGKVKNIFPDISSWRTISFKDYITLCKQNYIKMEINTKPKMVI
jgi:hypothetical protein